MKRSFLVLLLFLLAAGSALSGDLKEIELSDGSVITGEVVSLVNGIYTIRTGPLGTVKVNDSRVKSIRSRGSAPAASTPAPSSAEVSSLTEKMMADGEIMEMIRSLKDDPAFQKALEDPEIRNAVSTGDTASLMANPKFLELMNNATVREIQQKVQK